MEARNQRVTGVMGQVLHFPIICHPRFFPRDRYEYQSYEQNKETSVLVPRFMEQAYGAYLLNLQPDPRHSPLLAGSHSDLPPARKSLCVPLHALWHLILSLVVFGGTEVAKQLFQSSKSPEWIFCETRPLPTPRHSRTAA